MTTTAFAVNFLFLFDISKLIEFRNPPVHSRDKCDLAKAIVPRGSGFRIGYKKQQRPYEIDIKWRTSVASYIKSL